MLALMAVALIYMSAVRLWEWRAARLEEQEIAAQNDGDIFTFQRIPISLAAPEAEPMRKPIEYQRPYPEIYLEDAPLSAQQQKVQAQETIASIVEDFKNEPAVIQFNQELQEASEGEVKDLADLSTQNLQQILLKNPQIIQIVEKHAKKADFSKILQEIFENPQFQQSVKELQGEDAVVQNNLPNKP